MANRWGNSYRLYFGGLQNHCRWWWQPWNNKMLAFGRKVMTNLDSILVLWLPHAKSWLIGKDSDAGRDWGQKEKGTTEDVMAGWHHWLDGHEFKWTLGVADGHGSLACYNSWGRKESDRTKQLNWTGESPHIHWILWHSFCTLQWNLKFTNCNAEMHRTLGQPKSNTNNWYTLSK